MTRLDLSHRCRRGTLRLLPASSLALTLVLTSQVSLAESPRDMSGAPPEAAIEDGFEPVEEDRRPWLGVVLDAGVPDGANLGLVARPLSWLRAHVGGSYNLASAGIRAGATYVPFDYWIVPTLTLEGGHFFTGSAKEAIRLVSGVDVDGAPEEVSYTYANGHLGLEFGGDWFTVFLRGGMSFVHATFRPSDVDNVRFEENVTASVWAPSAKLGLIFYVY